MFGSHPSRWIIFLVSGALTALGCVGSTDTGGQGDTGSLSVDLVLADGIEIDEVDWQITGNGMDMSGDIDVSAPGSTASVEVFGLPPGETDYTVTLRATSTDEKVTCEGSAPFNVEIGEATEVMVMLNCKKPRTLGGVRVNGKFNICAQLTKVVVSPLQTSVGNDISLAAQAFDEEGDPITFSWTGDGGSIADPTAASTSYTCTAVGDHSVTIRVTDNDQYCDMATWTVPVTCVEGDGGDLCEDVECMDDGNDCTETACNSANGMCETSNLADGTECDGGTCAAGVCVEENLCEGVDCSDGNECTENTCNPADGSCSNPNVNNGTPCNDDTGMCVDGTCMDSDLCEGVTCDDTGNECTVAMCNTANGMCETMNVTDGTVCNGGAGACSAGVCIDSSLCDGVDCTSANDCIQDGTCDPASGECIPGGNEPADTACASNGGSVCDGAGACVECNSGAQCPDDSNECTAAACDANSCGQNNVMDGQVCDFGGASGVCEAGTCVAAPQCTGPGDCDDGNPCTAGSCPDGMCVFTPADGGACEVSAGVPGTCSGGACVGLCDGIDCSSANDCFQDGTCDPANGQCVDGAPEPLDTACASSGGSVCDGAGACVECNNNTQCTGGAACVGNSCQASNVDFPELTVAIDLGCNNNALPQQSVIPADLQVDPAPLGAGSAFTATVGGLLTFPESFLDVAQTVVVGGVQQADLIAAQLTALVRTGATGSGVALGPDLSSTPSTCLITSTACDTANNVPAGGNSDCVPTGSFNPCQTLITVPTTDSLATCQSLDPAGCTVGTDCTKSDQHVLNGFCVTGPLPVPMETLTGNYTAGASGETIRFGWDDQNTDATLSGGEWTVPTPVFTNPVGPNGLKVNASGLAVAIECVMAVEIGDTNTDPVELGVTPNGLLLGESVYVIP